MNDRQSDADTTGAETGINSGSDTPGGGSDRSLWRGSRRRFLGTTAGIGVGSALGVAAVGTGSAQTDGATVYIGETGSGNGEGHLYAVDAATGQRQWTFTEATLIHSSPTVVEGTLYVGSGSEETTTLYAVDAETGDREWQFTGPGQFMFSSPTVVNGTVYVGADDTFVYAVDAATGTEEWSFEAGGRVNSSPHVINGTVYFGSGTAFETGEQDSTIYAVDAETGGEEWQFTEPTDSVLSSPTVAEGTLYAGAGRSGNPSDSTLYAVDTATGTQEWAYTDPITSVISSPTVVGRTVYVGTGRGAVGNAGNLHAVDAETGTQEWMFTDPDESVASSPTVWEGTVYVGDGSGNVSNPPESGTMYAVDAATGTLEWEDDLGEPILSSPTVHDGIVYVGTIAGNLYAFDAETGDREWTFDDTNAALPSSPTVVTDPGSGDSVGTRVTLGTLGHNDAWPGGWDDEPFDFGVELEQGVAVVQGRDADVSVFVNNNADASVSGVTVELLVDADDDGFTDGDVVASQTAGFDAGEYREIVLTYENVQLAPGGYDYRGRVSKGDQTTASFTDSTLTVTEGGDGPPPLPGQDDPPRDLDGDGNYEDIDGDGELSIRDVQLFFQYRDSDVVQNNASDFNFSGNDPDEVTIGDVQALFQLFTEQ